MFLNNSLICNEKVNSHLHHILLHNNPSSSALTVFCNTSHSSFLIDAKAYLKCLKMLFMLNLVFSGLPLFLENWKSWKLMEFLVNTGQIYE